VTRTEQELAVAAVIRATAVLPAETIGRLAVEIVKRFEVIPK
jgi:hypothetical protein